MRCRNGRPGEKALADEIAGMRAHRVIGDIAHRAALRRSRLVHLEHCVNPACVSPLVSDEAKIGADRRSTQVRWQLCSARAWRAGRIGRDLVDQPAGATEQQGSTLHIAGLNQAPGFGG